MSAGRLTTCAPHAQCQVLGSDACADSKRPVRSRSCMSGTLLLEKRGRQAGSQSYVCTPERDCCRRHWPPARICCLSGWWAPLQVSGTLHAGSHPLHCSACAVTRARLACMQGKQSHSVRSTQQAPAPWTSRACPQGHDTRLVQTRLASLVRLSRVIFSSASDPAYSAKQSWRSPHRVCCRGALRPTFCNLATSSDVSKYFLLCGVDGPF